MISSFITHVDMVDVALIHVGDRLREVYDEAYIDELADSMTRLGVISPLAVQKRDGGYELIAGGCRIKAIEKAGLRGVPVQIYPPDLSKEDLLSIELEENLKRRDLDWKERVKGTKMLEDLKIAQLGRRSTGSDDEGWSQQRTSELLGVSRSTVQKDVQLAEAIEEYPELAECKTASEATLRLDGIKRKMLEAELVKRMEEDAKSSTIGTARQAIVDSYMLCDFFEGVKAVPDGSVNFVELDPPYGIDFKDLHKNIEVAKEHLGQTAAQYVSRADYVEVKRDEYLDFIERVLAECYRVMAPNSWIIVWHSTEWTSMMTTMMRDAGFAVKPACIFWYKPGRGRTYNPHLEIPVDYEPILYGRKGVPTLQKMGHSSIFECSSCPPGETKYHPTQKPILLMIHLLEIFTIPGDTVMVPFLGSGATLLAASNIKRKAFGFELSEPYKNSFAYRVYKAIPGDFADIEVIYMKDMPREEFEDLDVGEEEGASE